MQGRLDPKIQHKNQKQRLNKQQASNYQNGRLAAEIQKTDKDEGKEENNPKHGKPLLPDRHIKVGIRSAVGFPNVPTDKRNNGYSQYSNRSPYSFLSVLNAKGAVDNEQ